MAELQKLLDSKEVADQLKKSSVDRGIAHVLESKAQSAKFYNWAHAELHKVYAAHPGDMKTMTSTHVVEALITAFEVHKADQALRFAAIRSRLRGEIIYCWHKTTADRIANMGVSRTREELALEALWAQFLRDDPSQGNRLRTFSPPPQQH